MSVSSAVLNLMKTAQMKFVLLQKETYSTVIPQDYFVTQSIASCFERTISVVSLNSSIFFATGKTNDMKKNKPSGNIIGKQIPVQTSQRLINQIYSDQTHPWLLSSFSVKQNTDSLTEGSLVKVTCKVGAKES